MTKYFEVLEILLKQERVRDKMSRFYHGVSQEAQREADDLRAEMERVEGARLMRDLLAE